MKTATILSFPPARDRQLSGLGDTERILFFGNQSDTLDGLGTFCVAHLQLHHICIGRGGLWSHQFSSFSIHFGINGFGSEIRNRVIADKSTVPARAQPAMPDARQDGLPR